MSVGPIPLVSNVTRLRQAARQSRLVGRWMERKRGRWEMESIVVDGWWLIVYVRVLYVVNRYCVGCLFFFVC